MRHLQITEIFQSIQGEGRHAGLPCVFIRLTGCNLRCRWCDTEYSFHGGRRMALEDVLAAAEAYACPLVEITGGEPMLQEAAVADLSRQLLAAGLEVLIETSGERDLTALPAEVRKIVDVKCPESGESGKFLLANLGLMQDWDELKFVIADRGDYEFARAFVAAHGLTGQTPHLLLSPAFRKDAAGERSTAQCALDPRELADWMLADRLPARLSMQVHKFIWDPAMKGV